MARRQHTSRDQLAAALGQADGNVTRAAAILQISREHATRLAKKFSLRDAALQRRVALGEPPTGRPFKKP